MNSSGFTFRRVREEMIENLLEMGIKDFRVLDAISQVPRHIFIDEAFHSRAYENRSLTIGYKQTISQPYIVAKMTEHLISHTKSRGKIFDKVLELGSGCGYQSAVLSFPMPMLNILNGGEHADNNIDIQEFMIIPKGAKSFKEAMRWSSEIYWNLKSILKKQKLSTAVGDEGGFAPNLQSNEEAIKLIIEAVENSNLIPGKDIFIALDCAASEFFDGDNYNLLGEGRSLNSESFADYLEELVDRYPIISIEDGMDENDYEGWKILTQKIGAKCQLVGDSRL